MSSFFSFPTFQQLFPNEKRKLKRFREYIRYQLACSFFKKECQRLTSFINQDPFRVTLFNQNLYRANVLLSSYCDKRCNAKQRLDLIIANLNVIEEKLGKELLNLLLEKQSIILADLTEELSLNLNINNIDPFEGFFSLNIQDKRTRQSIYDASFTFLNPNQLLIASIQGPKGENAQDLVRNATKNLHGVRPMFMLINGFKLLAQKWHCELLGIPHKYQAKYRWNDSTKLLFNYDEFWQENGAALNDAYWQIPCHIEQKPLEEIASKKRSMYRKRYNMFDQMQEQIHQVL
ncbi:VirK/YbjX family protein [Pasteurellaceae bacterium 22721_9_1]